MFPNNRTQVVFCCDDIVACRGTDTLLFKTDYTFITLRFEENPVEPGIIFKRKITEKLLVWKNESKGEQR